MRSILMVLMSLAITILCWGVYGPVLHWGQEGMSTTGQHARLLPFVCVGLAYFAIGVVVPAAWLGSRGEAGRWTLLGVGLSLAAGTLGALGALGIILAFNFGGKPNYVMPLVFGGAPVVNSFLTIYLAKRMKEIGPIFLAGLLMVLLGALAVLIAKPGVKHQVDLAPHNSAQTVPTSDSAAESEGAGIVKATDNFLLQILSIVTVVVCWGAYGPVLHKGQAAMQHSRLRPLLCVGFAYFVIAVVGSEALLIAMPEQSAWTFWGTVWSLAAGAAGAIGALGIILAFNFGGRPIYVMPLVFGGAPVVNTFCTIVARDQFSQVHPLFLAGLILAISGAVMVLVFAPKAPPPKSSKKDASEKQQAPTKKSDPIPEEPAPAPKAE